MVKSHTLGRSSKKVFDAKGLIKMLQNGTFINKSPPIWGFSSPYLVHNSFEIRRIRLMDSPKEVHHAGTIRYVCSCLTRDRAETA